MIQIAALYVVMANLTETAAYVKAAAKRPPKPSIACAVAGNPSLLARLIDRLIARLDIRDFEQ